MKLSKSNKIEFPCDDYLFKVMGDNEASLESFVEQVLIKYDSTISQSMFTRQLSRNGRFVSLTIKMRIERESDLTHLHLELKSNPIIKMVL